MSGVPAAVRHPAVAVLALTASVALYVELAVARALPHLLPALLERALIPESELRASLLIAFRIIALAAPALAVPAIAFAAWVLLRVLRSPPRFARVFAAAARASWWIAGGFLAKTLLVLKTGQPDPSMSLAAFLRPDASWARALLALTNPFVILAGVTMIRTLRADGASRFAAPWAGASPWAAAAVALALFSAGGSLYEPPAPVPTDGWPTLSEGAVTLVCPPGAEPRGREIAHLMSAFTIRLAERLGFESRPVRVIVYADHAMLERATGERLHVQVVGSVRGADLLYLEMPGRNAAVTPARAMREALRYVGLVELAPVAAAAPRWWIEGFVHASVHPGTGELNRDFRAVLRRTGVPSYDALLQADSFRGPEGALIARSLVDHIAFTSGTDAPEKIMRDVIAGASFRDALFAHTRLTTTALEAGWREALSALPEGQTSAPAPAPADSGRLDEVEPFLKGGR